MFQNLIFVTRMLWSTKYEFIIKIKLKVGIRFTWFQESGCFFWYSESDSFEFSQNFEDDVVGALVGSVPRRQAVKVDKTAKQIDVLLKQKKIRNLIT